MNYSFLFVKWVRLDCISVAYKERLDMAKSSGFAQKHDKMMQQVNAISLQGLKFFQYNLFSFMGDIFYGVT